MTPSLQGKRALVTGASLLLHGNSRPEAAQALAVQLIVNNADGAEFPGMKAKQWYRVIDVSLHCFFRITQPRLLPILRTRWRRII